jgi:hypothetical protein
MHRVLRLLAVFTGILILSNSLNAQLSGIYTVPGSFPSLAVAINSLNTYGVAGPVTVNIAAGYTETAISGGYSLYPVVGSSSVNTVTFRKNGAGANPIIYAYTGGLTSSSFTQDVVWRFIGADHITVDRINITDLNSSNPATMEAGIAFFKRSPNNGCQYNTISNCVITLKKTNNAAGSGSAVGGSRGIDMVNTYPASHHFNIPVTSVNGSHSYNRFYGNLIQDCNFGFSLNSIVNGTIPAIYHDSYNDIGGTSAVTGNTVVNFGGGGTLTAAGGIYARGQREINVSNNLVNNNTGTGANQRAHELYGIFTGQEAGTNVTITGNTVTVKSGSACPAMYAIYNEAGSAGMGNTVTITDNLVRNVTFTITGVDYYGIRNIASADHLIMSQNTFSNNVNNQSLSGVTYVISNEGAVKSTIDISNNSVTHSVSVFGGYNGTLRAISSLNTPTSVAITIANNTFPNFYIATSGSPDYIFLSGANASLTISNNTWNNLINYNTAGTAMISVNSESSYSLNVSNNAITNFSVPIQAYSFAGVAVSGDSPSTCTMTIANNTVANIQYTTTGNTANLTGIYVYGGEGPTYPLKYIYNNLVRDIDNNTYGGVTGMLVGLLGEGGAGGISSVHHNTVTNLSADGNIFGIRTWSLVAPNNYCEIHSNVVHSVVCTSTNQAIGVQFDNGRGKVKFYRNKITNITTLGSVLQAWGIEAVEGDSIYIYNNIIGNITAGFSGSQDASQGIFIVDKGYYGVYYNTIYLMGGAYGSSCVHAYSTPTVDLRNNIMVNLSTTSGNGITAAYRRVSQTMTGYSPLTNNNLYYAGTPANNRALVRWGAQTWSTTAQVKAFLSGRDYNTVTENVPFASVTSTTSNYLHISTTTTTQVEGGAQPISWITDDFYGNPRNANYPDIGAIEGSYTPSTGDQLQPTVRSYGFSSHSCGQSGRTFTVQLGDRAGVATGTNSPRMYYRINTGAWTSVQGSLATGSSTLGTWTFSMTYAVNYGDVISWYMVAQDVATTPNLVSWPPGSNLGTNVNTLNAPPVPDTYTVYMPLGGTYSVGAGGNFTTLNAAANAYNYACLTGPVTFVLTNTLYSASTETFPVVFKRNADASATNSLLIRPSGGTSVTIQGPTTGNLAQVIKLLDARHVKIDGGPPGAGLTIDNINTQFVTPCILIASSNTTGAGCSNISVNKIKITGSEYAIGILASVDNAQTASMTGANNDFVSITGNTIQAVSYAILASGGGTNTYGGNNDWTIAGNQVGPATCSLTAVYGYNPGAMYLQYVQNLSIVSNTITDYGRSSAFIYGINLNLGVSNAVVSHNQISAITSTAGYVTGIELSAGAKCKILVSNNMISALSGNANPQSVFGIKLGPYTPTGEVQILNNSIALNNGTVSGTQGPQSGSCLEFNGATYPIVVKNNLLYSNLFHSTNSSARYYGVKSTVSASVFSTFDYNNYSINGTQGVMGLIASQTRTTLAAMAAGFGGNLNSVSLLPAFSASTDLHIDPSVPANVLLEGLGATDQLVSTDIDNQQRSLSAPDIGADEFTVTASCTGANGGSISPAAYTVCSTTSLSLVSASISGGVGTIYQWQSAPTPTGSFSSLTAGSGINTPYYNTQGQLTGGVYYIRLNASCPSASLSSASNVVTITIVSSPSITILQSHTTVCAGNSATLSASGANTFSWSTGVTSPSIVITPTTSGMYYVYYGSFPCTYSTSENLSVFYSLNPTVTASSSHTSVCAGFPTTLTAAGAVTYSWSQGPGTSSYVVTPTTSSIYFVTGYLANGCNAAAIRSINVVASPTITITGPGTVCPGQQVTLTAGGSSTYTWSTGALTASAAVTTTATSVYTVAGNYSVSNSGGSPVPVCPAFATHTVTLSGAQSLSITAPSSVCAGQTATITVSGATNYTWSTGQSTATITPSPTVTTAYTVVGVSGSCTNTASVTVYMSTNPTITISGSGTVCAGSTTTLTASGATSYSWNTGTTTASVSVSPTVNTTYIVTGTNSSGCASSASLALNINQSPTISIGQSAATVCAGSPVTFTATGANSYTWTGIGSSNPITVTPSTSTIYTVAGSNSAGCITTKTVAVTTNSLPVITIIPGSVTVCPQTTLVPSASGATSYSWAGIGSLIVVSSGNDSPTVTAMSSGTLYVIGANSSGCTGTSSMVISTHSLPIVSITGNNTICAGQTATLTASGAVSYSWSTAAQGPSITVSPVTNTSYTVTGANAAGCTSVATATVFSYAYPTISIAPSSPTVCSSAPLTLTASGAASYSWTGIGSLNPVTINPVSNAVYTVTGTNGGICSSTGTVAVSTISVPIISVSPLSGTVCVQTPLSFTAGGASTYTWSNGGGNNAAVSFTPSASTVYTVSGSSSNGCSASKTVAVTTNSLPLVGISGNNAVCAGSSGTLTASGAASYSWNTGATTAVIVVTPGISTSFVVTGTNSAGCSASATMAVVVNTVPVITIAQSAQTVCVNSPVTLTASGAASYSWTGFGNFSSIINTPSGYTTYTVTGTSAAGCSSSATAAVATNSLPVIVVSPASYTVCSLTPVSFTAGGAITYTWTNGGGNNATATFTPGSASVFTVYGTDAGNGCVGSATVSVMTNTLPALSISGSTAVCYGGSATLTAGGATSYSWAGGPSTASFAVTPAASTVYVVTGTNAAGCVSSASYAVTSNSLPVITIAQSANPVCVNSDVTFTASGAASYTWTNYGSGNPITVTPTASTVYSVTGTSSAGCVSGATVGISTTPLPVIVVTPPTATVCAFTPVSFLAAGAITYTWSNGANGQSSIYNLSASGLQTVSGTNALGCVGTRTFFISIMPAPAVSVTAVPPAICAGNSAVLFASGAASYTWSNGSNSPTISVSPAGSSAYLVTGSNTMGCVGSASLQLVVHPLPVISISPSSATICLGDSLQLVAGGAASYSWSPGSLTGSSIKVSPDTVTVYSVDATDANGCTGQAQLIVAIDLCTGFTEIQKGDAGIYLYPNPSFGRFTTEFRFPGEKLITVYNTAGQRILQLRSDAGMETFDFAQYAKGLYMVNVRAGTRSENFRVIIQ